MAYSDAGPWKRGALGVRQRIAYAVRLWCAAEGVAPSSAAAHLAKGWIGGRPVSNTTIHMWTGSAYAKQPQANAIPRGVLLWALCERIGVSAEWIFTGAGAMRRGETRARAELGAELADLVAARVADLVPPRTVAVKYETVTETKKGSTVTRPTHPETFVPFAVRPALEPDGARLVEFLLAAARQEVTRQLFELRRDDLWQEAEGPGAIGPEHPRRERARDARRALQESYADQALAEGTGPLGLFRVAGGAAGLHAFDPDGGPLPPFQIRVLPIEPNSNHDPRRIARITRMLRKSRANPGAG